MWTKTYKTNTYEYKNNRFNIYDISGESRQLITSLDIKINTEKDFDMEIIYYNEKAASVDTFFN